MFFLNFISITTKFRGSYNHMSEKKAFPSCLLMFFTGNTLVIKMKLY